MLLQLYNPASSFFIVLSKAKGHTIDRLTPAVNDVMTCSLPACKANYYVVSFKPLALEAHGNGLLAGQEEL